MATRNQVRAVFEDAGVAPAPGAIDRIVNEGRPLSQVRSDVQWVQRWLADNPDAAADPGGHRRVGAVSRNEVQAVFDEFGVSPAPGAVDRISREGRPLSEVRRDVQWVRNWLQNNPDQNTDPGGHSLVPSSDPRPEPAPNPSQPAPGVPDVPQRDWRGDAQAMYPWLTPGLLDTFANEWADTGNPTLALAYVRQSGEYARVFPGIKRDDGSLRMSEAEYFGTKAGFDEALSEFGRNPNQYRKRYEQLFRNDVSAQEFFQAIGQASDRFVEPGTDEGQTLVDRFIDSFVGAGSAQEALDDVRDSDEYDNVFAGNRRDDGSLRMDEPEYFSYKRGWRRLFVSRGLNPEPFESHGRFVDAVEGEVSIQELEGRLSAVEQGVMANTEATRDWFADKYGAEGAAFLGAVDEGEMLPSALAMAIDPDVGNDLLQRRITASQIGGEAQVQGFARSIERAEELARAGINQQQARELYGQAGRQLSGISATTARFNRGRTSLGQFEGAMGLGDADERSRIERALQSEQSSFSSRADTRRERDGFGLRGLRQR